MRGLLPRRRQQCGRLPSAAAPTISPYGPPALMCATPFPLGCPHGSFFLLSDVGLAHEPKGAWFCAGCSAAAAEGGGWAAAAAAPWTWGRRTLRWHARCRVVVVRREPVHGCDSDSLPPIAFTESHRIRRSYALLQRQRCVSAAPAPASVASAAASAAAAPAPSTSPSPTPTLFAGSSSAQLLLASCSRERVADACFVAAATALIVCACALAGLALVIRHRRQHGTPSPVGGLKAAAASTRYACGRSPARAARSGGDEGGRGSPQRRRRSGRAAV